MPTRRSPETTTSAPMCLSDIIRMASYTVASGAINHTPWPFSRRISSMGSLKEISGSAVRTADFIEHLSVREMHREGKTSHGRRQDRLPHRAFLAHGFRRG